MYHMGQPLVVAWLLYLVGGCITYTINYFQAYKQFTDGLSFSIAMYATVFSNLVNIT